LERVVRCQVDTRGLRKESMAHLEDTARQAREMGQAGHQGCTTLVETRVRKLGISRELAEYLVGLEMRIEALENQPRTGTQ
jgi:hypothetical protein